MPLLNSLDIRARQQLPDLTTSLVWILDHQAGLERLHINYSNVDTRQLCEALKRNTSLKHYAICGSLDCPKKQSSFIVALEEANDSLETVCNASFHGKDEPVNFDRRMSVRSNKEVRIEYILLLNKCGRKVAKHPDTSIATFVQLLSNVDHVVQFGFLIERPGLWAG